MTYLFAFGWWLLGFSTFLYWITKVSNADTKDVVVSFFVGWLGPLAWLIGWLILGDELKLPRKVFFKRRNP